MIPISTDAPIYHWPIATVTTIVLNVVCFLVFCLNDVSGDGGLVAPDGHTIGSREQLEMELNEFETEEEMEKFLDSLKPKRSGWVQSLSVEFGELKPWQWLTNNFMHASWGHLIGNMIFLWAFGLIVEGKVGPVVFSLIYLGIGVAYGGVLQLSSMVVGWQGIALGASAAIFGLLALCIAWAPANEFTILFRFTTFDISILLYGGLFIAKELGFWALAGFRMSSELLHIIGFAVALPLGLWMVRAGRVDCEGWDLFSYLAGTTGETSKVGKAKSLDRQRASNQKQKEKDARQLSQQLAEREVANQRLYEQVPQAIEQGNIDLAIKLQNRFMQSDPKASWKQKDLYRVIQALIKSKDFSRALPLMERHIESFEQSRFPMQITMIKIWLSQREAKKALAYMQGFNASFMTAEEVQQIKQLSATAKKQMESGD